MYDIGAKGVLEKLLPVVDNFERALAAIPEDEKGRPFESGVANIYKQLMTSLDSIGVKPMDCAGRSGRFLMKNGSTLMCAQVIRQSLVICYADAERRTFHASVQ